MWIAGSDSVIMGNRINFSGGYVTGGPAYVFGIDAGGSSSVVVIGNVVGEYSVQEGACAAIRMDGDYCVAAGNVAHAYDIQNDGASCVTVGNLCMGDDDFNTGHVEASDGMCIGNVSYGSSTEPGSAEIAGNI